jgi:adenine-specific DNA-methyltransferase
MEKFKNNLYQLLKKDTRLWDEETKEINETLLKDLIDNLDEKLIELLLSDKETKEKFFIKIKDVYVLKQKELKFFIDENKLDNSYTQYKNKIGLRVGNKLLSERDEVVLDWPFKDCVLEGGMTKEDQKRNEIFFNEVLAKDEIDRLLDPKALVNWKRYTAKGEEKVKELKRDKDGTIRENLIIKGNNLLALHSLKEQFAGKVKLIYIDPPFNTGSDTFTYNDRFSQSTWLTFMKNRLEVARNLLDKDGNIFVHIDDNQCFELKILMDEVFKKENFVETIIWAYGSPSGGRAAGPKLVGIHDYILHYAKNYTERKQFKVYTPYSDKYLKDWFKYKDKEGRIYRRRMRGRDEKGNVVWEKQYLDESPGVPGCTVWTDIKQIYADPRAFKAEQRKYTEMTEYNTQKPEALLKRIVEYSTSEGDLILDFFNGSGTTTAVAHKMKRRWIGVEQLEEGAETFVKRMKKILNGDQTGISKSVNWQGGGDFVYVELAKWNEEAKEKILKAKSLSELEKLFDELYEQYFLNYNIKTKEFKETIKEDGFRKLSLDEQKKLFVEMLDMNQMYVNFSERNDKKYNLSKEDIALSEEFYNAKK